MNDAYLMGVLNRSASLQNKVSRSLIVSRWSSQCLMIDVPETYFIATKACPLSVTPAFYTVAMLGWFISA